MAVRMSKVTGNWLTAATWGLVDSTSYNNDETTTTALTTAYQASSPFTPGAITVEGVAVKLSVRTGTTGTISVHLATAGVEKTGTLVTINVADLPAAVTADLNGGWVFFKFASPVTLSGATAYAVEAKTSSASQVSLFSTATTNWARALRTSTTGAPAAGDDLIVCGEYTGAGTSNTLTVTMDALEGAITDYGAASTSIVTPALAICSKGLLKYGTTAATAYYLRISGNIIVYAGGEFDIGTVATPIPRGSTAKLNLDSGVALDFALIVRNLGTWIAQGLSRTSGKNVATCKLSANAAANATSLTVNADTGWLSGDSIAVAATSRTFSECEAGTLNGNAGASTLTVNGFAGTGGGVAFAHLGTSPTQGEIIMLTRNVQVFGASLTLTGYIQIRETAIVDLDWTEFKWLGSATAGKKGIEHYTNSPSLSGQLTMDFCSLHDCQGGFACNLNFGFYPTLAIADCVSYNCGITSGASHFLLMQSSSQVRIVCIAQATGSAMIAFGGSGTTTDITAVGHATGSGGSILASALYNPSVTNARLTAHSNNNSYGIFIGSRADELFTDCIAWRNSTNGIGIGGSPGGLIIRNPIAFGNGSAGIAMNGVDILIDNPQLNGDTSFGQGDGILFAFRTTSPGIRIFGGSIGVASGILTTHSNADIDVTADHTFASVAIEGTLFGSATPVFIATSSHLKTLVGASKFNGVAGSHRSWRTKGTVDINTSVVHTGSQSMAMTPNASAAASFMANATNYKLESPSFFVAVANGATVTPTVWLNKSAAYNGNQPRLVLKRNDAIGITADTVIATYSAGTGSWNSISGTTPAATDDGVMEFVVDCDYGTGGIVYVDSLSAA